VKRNSLRANEIVTWRNATGNIERVVAAVVIEGHVPPVVWINGDKANFRDLEPVGIGANSGHSIVDLGHVHDDWAVVVTTNGQFCARTVSRLLMHLHCHVRACGN